MQFGQHMCFCFDAIAQIPTDVPLVVLEVLCMPDAKAMMRLWLCARSSKPSLHANAKIYQTKNNLFSVIRNYTYRKMSCCLFKSSSFLSRIGHILWAWWSRLLDCLEWPPFDMHNVFFLSFYVAFLFSSVFLYHSCLKQFEPWHDKINKVSVHLAKTQISLGPLPCLIRVRHLV